MYFICSVGDDGTFNLLEFTADSDLDQALGDVNDKNMFDEHLGLTNKPGAVPPPHSKASMLAANRTLLEKMPEATTSAKPKTGGSRAEVTKTEISAMQSTGTATLDHKPPAHKPPAHKPPGHTPPGTTIPVQITPGTSTPGSVTPGTSAPGTPTPIQGSKTSGQATPTMPTPATTPIPSQTNSAVSSPAKPESDPKIPASSVKPEEPMDTYQDGVTTEVVHPHQTPVNQGQPKDDKMQVAATTTSTSSVPTAVAPSTVASATVTPPQITKTLTETSVHSPVVETATPVCKPDLSSEKEPSESTVSIKTNVPQTSSVSTPEPAKAPTPPANNTAAPVASTASGVKPSITQSPLPETPKGASLEMAEASSSGVPKDLEADKTSPSNTITTPGDNVSTNTNVANPTETSSQADVDAMEGMIGIGSLKQIITHIII